MTKVIQCNCEHEFQDKTYGKYMRVHNMGKPDSIIKTYKCTVCGKEKKQ